MIFENKSIFESDFYDDQINSLTDSIHLDNISEGMYIQNDLIKESRTEENNIFFNSGPTNSDSWLKQDKNFEFEDNLVYPKTVMNIDEEKEESIEPKKTNDTTNKEGKEVFYTFKKIETEIIPTLGLSDDIKAKITKNEKEIEIIEKNLKTKKKDTSKNENTEIGCNNYQNFEIKNNRGRKMLGDKTKRDHNRDSFDNVIKKVKGDIFTKALSFLNQVLDLIISSDRKKALIKKVRNNQREPENKDLLKDLDYEIINILKKDFNLELLDMSFKELFSQNISRRYTAFNQDSNKVIIDIISVEDNNDIINYVFELKFIEWLNYFTHKTELEFLDKIEKEKNVKFERTEILLKDVGEMYDGYYFSNYLFHLYNYKWWFESKKGRNSKKSKKNESSL